ncbi:MAG: PHB depolymerase family esterase [Firmicutes bacterium]|nr:PHB depolymerase family esterase [Bacillota bacterium]
MTKYNSFHFSPENNRSMLMPRLPKQEAFAKAMEGHKTRAKYPLVPEEKLNKNPYFQCNLGMHLKDLELEGGKRTYGIYVPDGMISKGAGLVLFLPSEIRAADFVAYENWRALSEKYHTAVFLLESGSDGWTRESLEADFDFAWGVVSREFSGRLTVDVCESYFYPIGLGDAAAVAASFALTYSATFPAFAVDGDCDVDPELLDTLRALPSDGVKTRKKTDIAMPAFVTDRKGHGAALKNYLCQLMGWDGSAAYQNEYGEVYPQKPHAGAWFVNDQPTAEVWYGTGSEDLSREEWNEAMVRFVLRWSLWGGSGNNHLRRKESSAQMGMLRVELEVNGLPRFYDVYVPSCYRPGDKKQYPLVLAIHGMSCNAEYFEKTSEWHRVAEERGFFVAYASAYPYNDGLARFPVPHWALKTMDVEPQDELTYFRRLLEQMEANYHIDPKRIYAAGHSNGGQMTQVLLREMPEKFAAFGPTGSLLGWREDQVELPGKDIVCPVWLIMGEYDVANPEPRENAMAQRTIAAYAESNGAVSSGGWYDNGIYHTLSLYNTAHIPVVRYTIMQGCPHTYTAEMAELTWNEWFSHFTREPDGSAVYHG